MRHKKIFFNVAYFLMGICLGFFAFTNLGIISGVGILFIFVCVAFLHKFDHEIKPQEDTIIKSLTTQNKNEQAIAYLKKAYAQESKDIEFTPQNIFLVQLKVKKRLEGWCDANTLEVDHELIYKEWLDDKDL